MKYFIVFFVFLCSLRVDAQDIFGTWSGELNVGRYSLSVVFNISEDENGNKSCTLDSPDQGVKGVKTTVVLISKDSIKLDIPHIGADYKGCMKGGRIIGKFTQSGYVLDLVLERGGISRKRPQNPQPPFEYSTEEVYFANTEDGVMLCGTLTYPLGYENMEKYSVPVVLMVTGSGQQNRDEEIFDHKPFLVIADYLAKHGIASLRYDDRGAGKSEGKATEVTTYSNMKDAIAGLEYLKKRDEFGKIGVLGHSEGGCIAFMLGARKKTDFIVSLAGNAVRGDVICVEQSKIALRQSGMPENLCDAYCEVLKEICRYKTENKKNENSREVLDRIIAGLRVELPAAARDDLLKVLDTRNPWLDYFMQYDPGEDISRTQCPVMAVNGSLDRQVTVATNLGAIRKLLPVNKKNLIKEYPGLNHLFQHCRTGFLDEYGKIEETFSPDVLKDIAAWIISLK